MDLVNKKGFVDSIVATLDYLTQQHDYARLHRTILHYVSIADSDVEFSDKFYKRPADTTEGWEDYAFNFKNELYEHKRSVFYFNDALPMRETILYALVLYMSTWTAGG